jgi:hypothetical protein
VRPQAKETLLIVIMSVFLASETVKTANIYVGGNTLDSIV